jgi:hypothetical protein
MSSTLTPIAVDLAKVNEALGSGDEALLDLLLKKYQAQIAQVDELADELEEDEDEDDSGDDEEDEDRKHASLSALSQLLGKAKEGLKGGGSLDNALDGLKQPADVSKKHQAALQDLLNDDDDGDDDDDENAVADEASRGDYASAADVLRHLIVGGKPAKRVAFKFMYGHALQWICLHLGQELPHDQWHDLRGSTWARSLDKALKTVGVPPKTLSVSKHLADRGSPLKQVPKYSDNPSIGYLTAAEVTSALVALRDAKLDVLGEERASLEDIRGWLQTCADTQRDLVCFGE